MRCSNIGPRGARNWFRVLDSPRQVLSPHYRGTRCSAECNGSKLARPAASWVLREAKQVALRSARVPFGTTRKTAPPAYLFYFIRAWKVSIERYFADTWGGEVELDLAR